MNQILVQKIERYVELSEPIICRWPEFLRHIILDSMMFNLEKLGGTGKIVEIDESKFGRRKYHWGHHVDGQWIFGGYEVESGKCLLVPKRTESTLVSFIKEWILPGTTIRSDCWAAYCGLKNEGYIHETMNHSLHFKDSNTGCHPNHIDSTWRHAKKRCQVVIARENSMLNIWLFICLIKKSKVWEKILFFLLYYY